jgi:hypothetical protein
MIMNKTIKNRIGLFTTTMLCATILWSCSSVLEVRNEGQLSNDAALVSTDAAEVAVNGAYESLWSTLGAGNPWTTVDALGGDVYYEGSDFGFLEIYNLNMSLFTPNNRGLWTIGYEGINRANNVLEALPAITDTKISAARNRLRGECLLIRGILHFEMVRLWGQPWGFTADNSHAGIPLRVRATKGAAGAALPRSTVAQVYTQIIADLTEAESLLTETPVNERGHKAVAAAYLARVYFQQGNHQQANNAADRVIRGNRGGTRFALNSDLTTILTTSNSPEAVLQIAQPEQYNSSAGLIGMYRSTRFGAAPFSCSDDFIAFLNTIPANDARRGLYRQRNGADPRVYSYKFDLAIAPTSVIRLPEMLLVRAECAAELGRPDAEVRADYNLLRQRAGLAADNTTSGRDNLLNAIRRERRLELAFEGDRLHYLRRIRATNIRGQAWNSWRLIAKIPDVEISGNPDIELNP